jgi:hypothetical protein
MAKKPTKKGARRPEAQPAKKKTRSAPAKRNAKSRPTTRSVGKKATNKKATRASRASAAQERFVADLLVRNEAQHLGPGGKLAPQATHVIEKDEPSGLARVRRVRFKLV